MGAATKGGSSRSGPLPLHPMGVGDIIDGVFRLVRANAGALAPTLLLLALPFYALISYAGRNGASAFQIFSNLGSLQNQTSGTQGVSGWEWVGLAGIWLVQPVAAGAVCRAVAASYRGESLRAAQVAKMRAAQVLALVLASVVGHLFELVGLVLCVLPGLAVMAFLFLTAPAIVMEGLGPIAGLRRSLRLVSHHFWRVLGIMLLGCLLSYLVVLIMTLVPDLVAGVLSPHLRAVVAAIVGTVGAALQWALYANLAALLYLDQRIRQEGLDLEVMAARAR
jgi:hypothetical protein